MLLFLILINGGIRELIGYGIQPRLAWKSILAKYCKLFSFVKMERTSVQTFSSRKDWIRKIIQCVTTLA